MEKALWPQWNVTSWFIAPMAKAWFYERLFFEVVVFMVKHKKIQYKRCNFNQFQSKPVLCITPVGIIHLKVNNKNNLTRCKKCSKLTIKTPERRQCRLGREVDKSNDTNIFRGIWMVYIFWYFFLFAIIFHWWKVSTDLRPWGLILANFLFLGRRKGAILG